MLRRLSILVSVFLLPAVILPGAAFAYHESSALIDNLRYANESGGLRFFVDFRIWDHLGYPGTVRIQITDGIDTVVALRTFQPAFNAMYYRGFAVYVSNTRLIAEGSFVTQNLDVTVEVLDAGGYVLARKDYSVAWALGIL